VFKTPFTLHLFHCLEYQSSEIWFLREGVLLGSLSSDSSGQLNVLGHDGHSLGMDGAEVGILKEADEIGLGGFLQSSNSRRLESKIRLVILGNLSDESLEGQLADQEFGGLLVSSNLSEGDSSGAESMGLLDSSSRDGGFTGGLGCNMLSGGLSSSRFSGSLFGSSHYTIEMIIKESD